MRRRLQQVEFAGAFAIDPYSPFVATEPDMFGKLCYREKMLVAFAHPVFEKERVGIVVSVPDKGQSVVCLLYTSDAADEL